MQIDTQHFWFALGLIINLSVTIAGIAYALGKMASKQQSIQTELTEFKTTQEVRWRERRDEVAIRRREYKDLCRECKEGFKRYCDQHRTECSAGITKRLDNIEGYMRRLSEFMGEVNNFMRSQEPAKVVINQKES